jgi:hypothetical protein
MKESIIIHIPLDAPCRNEIASMVYARWSDAFTKLTEVKQLTWEATNRFCPKNEWPLYHKNLIESAETELITATVLKESICKYSPLIMGE